jgi:isoquinoline 1-oxidoreductase beta subunit
MFLRSKDPTVTPQLSRRTFLATSAAATGGLMLALHFDLPASAQGPPAKKYPPDAFVHIRPDGTIVIQVNRLEFGQGVNTALPLVLAEELDADWSQVVTELAPAGDLYRDPMFGIQMVGGSGSIAHSFQQYRELGARARAMLVAVAAKQWKTTPARCRTEASVVHGPNGKSLRYAELADHASGLPVPSKVTLKDPKDFRLIGKPTRRIDGAAKGNGTQKFGLDLRIPGMKTAVVAHPPIFGGRVRGFNGDAARKIEGVSQIFEIPLAGGGSAVAVVADGFWPAKQARDLLEIDWDVANLGRADTTKLLAEYRALAQKPGLKSVARGDAAAMDRAVDRITAEFDFPYLAHTPMEPLNATIRFDGDRAEAWIGSQFQTNDQVAVAEVLGVPAGRVTFHTEMTGGGFGRRATADSHLPREAAQIAKRVPGTPVKLIWTREDDVRGGYYRPMHVHRVEVGVDAEGRPMAWNHVIVGQSILAGTPFAGMLKDGVDGVTVEGVANTHYDLPNLQLSVHHPKVNVPVLWWRSVGNTHTAFVMETLIDELAVRAGADPIAYRRRLLSPEAKGLRAALDLMESRSAGWRAQLPAGHAVGIALHESFDTAVACAVDVSVENNRPKIHRVTLAVDCGTAVNPLTIESQCQGATVYGISQLVERGAITLRDGIVEQRNFDGHAPPYPADAPAAIDVHIVPSAAPPTGIGEPPTPVIAPAVVNALARLTGKRYRSLPLKL